MSCCSKRSLSFKSRLRCSLPISFSRLMSFCMSHIWQRPRGKSGGTSDVGSRPCRVRCHVEHIDHKLGSFGVPFGWGISAQRDLRFEREHPRIVSIIFIHHMPLHLLLWEGRTQDHDQYSRSATASACIPPNLDRCVGRFGRFPRFTSSFT